MQDIADQIYVFNRRLKMTPLKRLVLLYLVAVSLSSQQIAPLLSATQNLVVTTTGNYTEMSCTCGDSGNSSDSSSLDIVWRVNGTRVTSPEISSNYTVYPALGVLALKKTVPELQGTYTCELSTDSDISDTITVSIQEGCFPGAFRSFLPVGGSVSVPCYQYHSGYNTNGNITWKCVSHLTWEVDLSQCVFIQNSQEELDFALFLYRIPLRVDMIPASLLRTSFARFIDELLYDDLTADIPERSISDIGETGEVGYSYFLAKVTNPVDTGLLWRMVDVGEFEVSDQSESGSDINVTAVAVYSGILTYVAADSCHCPNIFRDVEGSLMNGDSITINICTSQLSYRSCDCRSQQNCTCSILFVEDPQVSGNCALDLDGDGIPSYVDTCEDCCAEESQGGFQWPATIEGNRRALSCSVLHNSFSLSSIATRLCVNHTWGPVDTSSCTFARGSNTSVVVLEGKVNLTHPQVESAGIDAAVYEELLVVFQEYNVLDYSTLSISNSSEYPLVAVALELPSNITDAVLNVYGAYTLSSVFINPPELYGHRAAETCPCTAYPSGTAGMLLDTCVGAPQPPCSCNSTRSGTVCECVDPYAPVYVQGDPFDVHCSLDSDGDRFPDVLDDCPFKYDENNNCQTLVDDGTVRCEEEQDVEWYLQWDITPVGYTDIQRCPGGIEETTGLATRLCLEGGEWSSPVVSECKTISITRAYQTLVDAHANLLNGLDRLQQLQVLLPLTSSQVSTLSTSLDILLHNSYPPNRYLLPYEVQTIILCVDIFAKFATYTTLFAEPNFDEDLLFILIDNVLADSDKDEWEVINQSFRQGAPLLLRSIETLSGVFRDNLWNYPYAFYETEGGQENLYAFLEGNYIFLFAESISIEFDPQDLLDVVKTRDSRSNFTQSSSSNKTFQSSGNIPSVDLPQALLQEIGISTVEVVTTVVDNLSRFLPRAQASDLIIDNFTVGSLLVSTQIARFTGFSDTLIESPIAFDFPIEPIFDEEDIFCAFWNFSADVQTTVLGGWSTDGLKRPVTGTSGASCSSTHLTTFAILVDTTGLETKIGKKELFALELVSYIGCGVSLACLLVTVIFFLCLRKELFRKVVYFVHLNLCISLICGLIVFLAGIETAVWSLAACTVVATLLHYFFLAAFSWMLCEGIMLYNLLVKVFGANKRKWIYIYTGLGWGIPVPIVAIAVGSRWEYYHIPQSYNTSDPLHNVTRACWLSHEHGTIAAFLVPMLAIVMVNVVFMLIALRSVYKVKSDNMQRTAKGMTSRAAGIALLKSTFILSPLLGVTWVVGLLAVNNYTTVFAWLFCFLNAFQGVFIFFFHVVRNDKVWSKLTRCCCKKPDTTTTSTSWRTASVSSWFGRRSRYSSSSSSSIAKSTPMLSKTKPLPSKEGSIVMDGNCVQQNVRWSTIDEVDENLQEAQNTSDN